MRGLIQNVPPFYDKISKACALSRPLEKIACLGNADAGSEQAKVDLEGFGYFCRSVNKIAEDRCRAIPDLPGKAQAATMAFFARCPTMGTKIAQLEVEGGDDILKDLATKLAGTLLVDVTLAHADAETEEDREKLAALGVVNAQYGMELLRNVL